MDAFIFNDETNLKPVHRAELAEGITGKFELLNALAAVLCFPDYFGGNWDALEECICDLSWLPPGDVILSHNDLPLSHDLV